MGSNYYLEGFDSQFWGVIGGNSELGFRRRIVLVNVCLRMEVLLRV